ncbi:MAG: transferrin-binding protein-like solute binding protein [Cardiobacteriaceae bacterium]|nr:transferrin-binding protein-like solute binding protein [Cardiobacteriaceae bacterium]
MEGGSEGNSTLSPTDPNTNTANNGQTNQATQENNASVSGAVRGSAAYLVGGDVKSSSNIGGNDLNSIVLNGKTIPVGLQVSTVHVGEMTSLSNSIFFGQAYRNFITSGENYRYSKFGLVEAGNDDVAFSHGYPTSNMPATGIMTYQGSAALGAQRDGGLITATGSSSAKADFSSKAVHVDITTDKSDTNYIAKVGSGISFDVTISGNTFSGNGTVSHGGFYGDNAPEIGGTFYNDEHNFSGAFGGHK